MHSSKALVALLAVIIAPARSLHAGHMRTSTRSLVESFATHSDATVGRRTAGLASNVYDAHEFTPNQRYEDAPDQIWSKPAPRRPQIDMGSVPCWTVVCEPSRDWRERAD